MFPYEWCALAYDKSGDIYKIVKQTTLILADDIDQARVKAGVELAALGKIGNDAKVFVRPFICGN